MLQVEVPETVMSSGTSDISQFYNNGFYDWVMFRDEPILYSIEKPVLDRYFGPEIDVGPEMTSNTMKGDGEFLHWST